MTGKERPRQGGGKLRFGPSLEEPSRGGQHQHRVGRVEQEVAQVEGPGVATRQSKVQVMGE